MLATACGGGDATGPDAHGPADAAATCTAREVSMTTPVPVVPYPGGGTHLASWQLAAVLSPTTAIAYAPTATDDQRLAWIDPDGVHDITTFTGAGEYDLKAARAGACAAVISRDGLGRLCPGQPFEAMPSTVRDDIASDGPLFAVEARGATWMFVQSFAAFSVFERDGGGVWTYHEQFESSVSFPTDALAAADDTVACYIDDAKRAVVSYGGGHQATSATAKWCKLALSDDGATLTVLTDIGRTSAPLASFTAPGALALDPLATPIAARPDRLVTLHGALYTLDRSDGVVLTPLDGGAPITFADEGSAVVALDGASGALSTISQTTSADDAGSGAAQTFRFTTRCL